MVRAQNLLIIGDLHCPFQHPDAFKFIDAVSSKYKTGRTILLGDEIEGHTISFHEKDPDIPFSASSELESAISALKTLFERFDRADVLESNHGSLIFRRGKFAGLPRSVFKSWKDILGAPAGWNWHHELIADGILFHHGFCSNALTASKIRGCSVIQGHYHSRASVDYWIGQIPLFGAFAGCLIDHESLAQNWAKNNLLRPALGLIVIENGNPVIIPMKTNWRKRWIGKL